MARTSRRYADIDDAEFDLTRIRARPQRISSTLEDWTIRDSQWQAANDDGDEPSIEVRRTSRFRRVAARVVGGLLIAGAFLGIAMIEGRTDGREAIVEWFTLGHPDQARHAEESVRQWVSSVIHH
jgi:hypothetical protein